MTDQHEARIIDLTNVRRIPRVKQTDDVLDFLGALGDGHTGTDDCPKCAELKAEFGLDVTMAKNKRSGRTLFFDVSEQANTQAMAQILNAFFNASVPEAPKEHWLFRNNGAWAKIIIGTLLTLIGAAAVILGIKLSLR